MCKEYINDMIERLNKWRINRLRKKIRPEVEKIMMQNYPSSVDEKGNWKPFRGSCHIIWKLEKRILKQRYNIDWKTPAEEHPDWRFD